MQLFASFLLLAIAASAPTTLLASSPSIVGEWTGVAISHGQQVPMRLKIVDSPSILQASLINGDEADQASSTSFSGQHLVVTFADYARTIDATLSPEGRLTGTFGTASVRYPIALSHHLCQTQPDINQPARSVVGDWEIAVKSAKDEAAWQLHIVPAPTPSSTIRAVIQRIDGDTGSLYGQCTAQGCMVSHLTAAGPALYRFTLGPEKDTLLVSNLLRADQTTDPQQNLIARRPAAARAAQLPGPTDPTQQTTMKEPAARFQFSAPDLTGHVVSNTDPQFDGKVVLVTVGGSWCPNCHDEAPFLESLYKEFHSSGLEVVNLSFEEDQDQVKDPARLRAFIARYHLTYTVLLAGVTDQLQEKIPQADHLNSWPTSFILGRDGRVREIHAGFAGPANPAAHDALIHEMTDLISRLLQEPIPSQAAFTDRPDSPQQIAVVECRCSLYP